MNRPDPVGARVVIPNTPNGQVRAGMLLNTLARKRLDNSGYPRRFDTVRLDTTPGGEAQLIVMYHPTRLDAIAAPVRRRVRPLATTAAKYVLSNHEKFPRRLFCAIEPYARGWVKRYQGWQL